MRFFKTGLRLLIDKSESKSKSFENAPMGGGWRRFEYISNKSFSSEYLVGSINSNTKYSGIGTFVNVLLSRWGFFGIVIVPFFIMFMIELFAIYTEVKYGKKKNN